MQEAPPTGSTCTMNFSQDQHARGTSHRINMLEALLTESRMKRTVSQDLNMQEELLTGPTCNRNFSQNQDAIGTSDLPMVVLP